MRFAGKKRHRIALFGEHSSDCVIWIKTPCGVVFYIVKPQRGKNMELYLIIITLMLAVIFLAAIAIIFILKLIIINQEKHERILFEKYVDFKPDTKNLIELANCYWAMEKNFSKYEEELSDNNKRRLKNSLRKIESYLQNSDVDIKDYTGRQYIDGLNVEIVEKEIDEKTKKPTVSDVIKPAILYRGSLVQRSRVIIKVGKE